MNGFEKHEIDHLSASSLNLWSNAPDQWVAKYLHGHKFTFGPAPLRGQCVEDAVAAMLAGSSNEEAISAAYNRFDAKFLIGDEQTTKERDLIEPMAILAFEELQQFGKPDFDDGNQHKVSINAKAENYEIPVIGFLDFVWPDHGLVVDLKTTTRIPSVMSQEHQLQRAIYQKAMGNYAVKFLYASGKKIALLEDGDVSEILARAKVMISRLERFLSLHSKDDALACVPHNPNSFYWRGDEPARLALFGT